MVKEENMDKELKARLYESFNVLSRKGRGGTYQYVEWKDVADRMNSIFGVNWSSSLQSVEVLNNNVIVRISVEIYDELTKNYYHQEGFGGAPLDEKLEAGNPHKAAYSKALKDACKKWGVALFLEEEDESRGSGDENTGPTIPPGFMGKETGVPPTTSELNVEEKVVIDVIKDETTKTITTATTPSVPQRSTRTAPPKQPAQLKKAQDAEEKKLVEEKKVVETKNSIPRIPAIPKSNSIPTSPSVSRPVSPMQPFSNSNNKELPMSSGGGQSLISDVQKAALQSILNLKGVEYESLARDAFAFNNVVKEPIPAADKLSYQEAVFVVKFGNDKFRKR
jgi:hypothetical protein